MAFDLTAVLRLRDNISGKMRSISSQANRMNTSFGGVKKAVGAATGALAAFGVGLGAINITKAIVGIGVEFDTQMSKVQAISGATSQEFEQLRNTARQLGKDTKFTMTEAGQAMEYMALAGWEVEEILSGLPGMLSLAAAGALDLGRASDITTDTMQAFGIAADEAGRVADVFAHAQASANTNVEQMGKQHCPAVKEFAA